MMMILVMMMMIMMLMLKMMMMMMTMKASSVERLRSQAPRHSIWPRTPSRESNPFQKPHWTEMQQCVGGLARFCMPTGSSDGPPRDSGGTDAQVPDAEVRSLMMIIAILAYAPHRQEPVTLVTPRFTQQSCAREYFSMNLGKDFFVAA